MGAPSSALTQSAPADASPAIAQPAYHPSMGDLMTMAIQPRHIKLYLAGELQNWSYAGYELGEPPTSLLPSPKHRSMPLKGR
jgi:hypothetical protein